MKGEKPAIEKLEVEDEEARLQRIQSTLEKLNAPSSAPVEHSPSFSPPVQPSKPHPIPPSELLSRVQAFLPALEASNAALAQRARDDPSSVDIEHVDEGAEQYIEMNLGLGVFEQRGARAEGSSEDDESTSDSSLHSSSDSGNESSDSESDDSASGSSHRSNTSSNARPSETLT